MNRREFCAATAPVLLAPVMLGATQPAAPKQEDVVLRIARIRVVRDKRYANADALPLDLPGSCTLIDLIAELPPKTKVANIISGDSASASDSDGTDLLAAAMRDKNIPEAERITRTLSTQLLTPSIRWIVGLPTHTAKTLNASLFARLRTCSGVRRITLQDTPDWKPIELNGLAAEYRSFNRFNNDHIDLRPAEAADHIYRADPRSNPAGSRNAPAHREKGLVGYIINKDANQPITLSVYTDEKIVTAALSVKDFELP